MPGLVHDDQRMHNMNEKEVTFVFGELLRQYQARAELTQQQLATKAEVSRNSISRWENFKSPPRDRETVLRLADALELSPEETADFLRSAQFTPEVGNETEGSEGLNIVYRPHAPRLDLPVFGHVQLRNEVLLTLVRPERTPGLVALTGIAGSGKTTLALWVANQPKVRSFFRGGVCGSVWAKRQT